MFKRKEINIKDRWKVYYRDNYSCKICGSRDGLTIDHIKPVCKGGENHADNYQTLCFRCNSKKMANGEGYTEYMKLTRTYSNMDSETEKQIEKIGEELLGLSFNKEEKKQNLLDFTKEKVKEILKIEYVIEKEN